MVRLCDTSDSWGVCILLGQVWADDQVDLVGLGAQPQPTFRSKDMHLDHASLWNPSRIGSRAIDILQLHFNTQWLEQHPYYHSGGHSHSDGKLVIDRDTTHNQVLLLVH